MIGRRSGIHIKSRSLSTTGWGLEKHLESVFKGASINQCIIAIRIHVVSVSGFPEHIDCILTPRDIYKHVLGLWQKTGKRQKTGKHHKPVIEKISLILKIVFPITAKCCLFHNGLSWEKHQKGKKSHRSLMNSIAAKNALILVIRNITPSIIKWTIIKGILH